MMVPLKKTKMSESSRSQFTLDTYSRRARLQPALLAGLPGALLVMAWFPNSWTAWSSLAGLLTYIGITALLARLSRNRGKAIQAEPYASWGGKPTTQALRHRGAGNPVQLNRRHVQLQKLLPDLHLPTEEEERANPE